MKGKLESKEMVTGRTQVNERVVQRTGWPLIVPVWTYNTSRITHRLIFVSVGKPETKEKVADRKQRPRKGWFSVEGDQGGALRWRGQACTLATGVDGACYWSG